MHSADEVGLCDPDTSEKQDTAKINAWLKTIKLDNFVYPANLIESRDPPKSIFVPEEVFLQKIIK